MGPGQNRRIPPVLRREKAAVADHVDVLSVSVGTAGIGGAAGTGTGTGTDAALSQRTKLRDPDARRPDAASGAVLYPAELCGQDAGICASAGNAAVYG